MGRVIIVDSRQVGYLGIVLGVSGRAKYSISLNDNIINLEYS